MSQLGSTYVHYVRICFQIPPFPAEVKVPIAKHIVHATISEDRKMKTITFDPGSLSQEGRSFRDRLVRKFLQYRTGAVVFESKAMAHDHETEQIFVDNPLANCVS